MALRFVIDRTIQICRGMGRDEPGRDDTQHWIALCCSSERVAKGLPLSSFPDTRQTDAEGLENSSNMAFEFLAKADQLRTRTD
ncbi:hypothetical protein [Pseudorhodobacter aquimaris]|uniref:hypothetical protein n=1 Tax=Pseudorhodobacter aquimaris TaxID=687412 RepID=UPI000ABBA56D|nr:hypothetical protein [Pseudorhodobacter aquimaris]